MEIVKQQWFWERALPAIFLLIGYIINSLLRIVTNHCKEKSKRKTQIRLEKFKMHKKIRFQAYSVLNEFIIESNLFYDPLENPEKGFIMVMEKVYFKKVKIYYYYYTKEIRENLKFLESQYLCIGNHDFIPEISFDEFCHSIGVNI